MTCGRYAGVDIGSMSAKHGGVFIVGCLYNILLLKFSNVAMPSKRGVFGTI